MNIEFSPKRILVLAPHPDDGEFGCGATLARFIAAGAEVHYRAFSLCEASLPKGVSKKQLNGELEASMAVLGIPPDHVQVRDYPVRHFPAHRQEILEDLVKDRGDIKPDLVFLPASTDIHQDHAAVSAEGLRAFKHASVLGYELPWNNVAFQSQALSQVESAHVEVKERAIACYASQSFRPYFQPSFIHSLARTRGTQLAVEYAEAFEVLRLAF